MPSHVVLTIGEAIIVVGPNGYRNGSAGLEVRLRDRPGVRLMLTASHVAGALGDMRCGEGDVHFGTMGGPRMGPCDVSLPPTPASDTDADAALFQIYRECGVINVIEDDPISATPADPDELEPWTAMIKRGARTGVTYGSLAPGRRTITASLDVAPGVAARLIRFRGGYWVMGDEGKPFAHPGDSGSVICVREGLAPTLLLVASDEDGNGFGFPLIRILRALRAEIVVAGSLGPEPRWLSP